MQLSGGDCIPDRGNSKVKGSKEAVNLEHLKNKSQGSQGG